MRLRILFTVFSVCLAILLVLIGFKTGYGKAAILAVSTFTTTFTSEPDTLVSTNTPAKKRQTVIETALKKALQDLEVQEKDIQSKVSPDSSIEMRASVPRGKPLEWVIWRLAIAAEQCGYKQKDCICEKPEKGCTVEFINRDQSQRPVTLFLKFAPRFYSQTANMALLIEDFGFVADQTTVEFLSFPAPLTVSLVPAKKLSSWTARIADEYKKEIVILLPMEPLPRSLKKYSSTTIMLHYPEQKIHNLLNDAVQSIPSYAGMCSFYGTGVLEDSRIMEIVLTQVKKRDGYFIDSRITRKSVVPSLVKKLSVPYVKIDGRISEKADSAKAADSLQHYWNTAQRTGRVLVAIPPTLPMIRALKGQLPELKKNGVRLVYVSELVNGGKGLRSGKRK